MTNKQRVKSEMKALNQCLDFIGDRARRKGKYQDRYIEIYQFLGMAWDRIGSYCEHWDGYKDNYCKICGQVKREVK